MTPSQIVKSAYRQARAAGFNASLKVWAARQESDPASPHHVTAKAWLANKAKQRRTSTEHRAVLGHSVVYDAAATRRGSH